MIVYDQDGLTLIQGDVRERLRELPHSEFNTCITSPPYWGLRDYGTAQWTGGADDCTHEPSQVWIDKNFNANSTLGSGNKTQSAAAKKKWYAEDGSCKSCGAKRTDRQLGLEASPEEYVSNMVGVFREVRRCLRKDGTLWLNIGDSYAGGGGFSPGSPSNQNGGSISSRQDNGTGAKPRKPSPPPGLKEKDLVGIPWRLAFALQADGWYLRSDIIWAKGISFCPAYSGSVMPESVTDRPTKGHEYLFLLSKSADYYCDMESIKERASSDGGGACFGKVNLDGPSSRRVSDSDNDRIRSGFRNPRTVWAINPGNYPGAHFATFPEDLVRPCILAGAPERGSVLEPFCGSGTTLKVARDFSRRATGIELKPAYCKLTTDRLSERLLFGLRSA